jgi:enoyl-CoA hydratase
MHGSEQQPDGPISVEYEGAVCRITLNRPQAMNAVTFDMLQHLNDVLDTVEQDESQRVLVLTGSGKAFCAGADLKDIRKRTLDATDADSATANAAFSGAFGELLKRLEDFPKPILAAVNGVAVAGGLEIILCCDLVIAAEEARIGDAHSNYGLLPGGGSTARLPRRVGVGLSKYLLYTGDILPAAEFIACGLVHSVVPGSALPGEVDSLAGKLAAKSPLVLRELKRLIQAGMQTSLHAALRDEHEANRAHATSHDRREGLTAFAERRKPIFTGR